MTDKWAPEEIKELRRELDTARVGNAELRRQLGAAADGLSELSRAYQQLQGKYLADGKELRAELDAVREELAAAHSAHRETRRQLEDLRKHGVSEGVESDLRKKVKHLEMELSQRGDVSELKAKVAYLEGVFKDTQDHKAQVESELTVARAAYSELMDELEAAHEKVKAVKRNMREAREETARHKEAMFTLIEVLGGLE